VTIQRIKTLARTHTHAAKVGFDRYEIYMAKIMVPSFIKTHWLAYTSIIWSEKQVSQLIADQGRGFGAQNLTPTPS
jgi:hypothetical protein